MIRSYGRRNWKDEDTCETCEFGIKLKKKNDGEKKIECHKGPPTAIIFLNDEGEREVSREFPQMEKDDVCAGHVKRIQE